MKAAVSDPDPCRQSAVAGCHWRGLWPGSVLTKRHPGCLAHFAVSSATKVPRLLGIHPRAMTEAATGVAFLLRACRRPCESGRARVPGLLGGDDPVNPISPCEGRMSDHTFRAPGGGRREPPSAEPLGTPGFRTFPRATGARSPSVTTSPASTLTLRVQRAVHFEPVPSLTGLGLVVAWQDHAIKRAVHRHHAPRRKLRTGCLGQHQKAPRGRASRSTSPSTSLVLFARYFLAATVLHGNEWDTRQLNRSRAFPARQLLPT